MENSAKMKLEVRRYVDGDEAAIIELFNRVFGKHMDPYSSDQEHWEWEYDGEDWRPKDIVLAWDKDTLAGHYGLIRRRFIIDGQETIGSQSLDTMTHPDYRGQSIFPTLAREIYGAMASDSVTLTYGFPNTNSIRGFLKLGWIELFPLPLRIYPLNPGRLMSLKWRLPGWTTRALDHLSHDPLRFLGSMRFGQFQIELQDILSFGPEFDRLWDKARLSFKIAAIRDSEFLRWRFQKRPGSAYSILTCHFRGELAGYVIWRLEDFSGLKVAYIMDMLVAPGQGRVLLFLLKRLISWCARNKLDAISMVVPRHHAYSSWAAWAGFFPVSRRLFPQEIYFGAYPHNPELSDLIKYPGAWYISWADTDLI